MCARPRTNPSAAGPAGDIKLPGCYLDSDDYTYYVSSRYEVNDDHDLGLLGLAHWAEHHQLLGPHGGAGCYSAACTCQVFKRDVAHEDVNSQHASHHVGRLLACRCYAGEAIAVTVRKLDQVGPVPPQKRGDATAKTSPADFKSSFLKESRPADVPFPMPLPSLLDQFDSLHLFDRNPSGLVLVTGSTQSGKSELTRALILQFLVEASSKKRWPHLVTYEDPIEKRLYSDQAKALRLQVEYTPRQKGIDVGSLKEALEDALRQTPAVFYVGEVREDSDWADVLRFAGTGHLIVATAHAGSLIEAMERIFRGVKAQTAAERGQIAQRILAVIHQRMLTPPSNTDFKVLLPTLWRRTISGIAALVGDGLSSVLPNNPTELAQIQRTSSFGRRWFVADEHELHQRWYPILLADHLGKDFDNSASPLYTVKNAVIGDDTSGTFAKTWAWLAKQEKWSDHLGYALVRSHPAWEGPLMYSPSLTEALKECGQRYTHRARITTSSTSTTTTDAPPAEDDLNCFVDALAKALEAKPEVNHRIETLKNEAKEATQTVIEEIRNEAIRYDLGGF